MAKQQTATSGFSTVYDRVDPASQINWGQLAYRDPMFALGMFLGNGFANYYNSRGQKNARDANEALRLKELGLDPDMVQQQNQQLNNGGITTDANGNVIGISGGGLQLPASPLNTYQPTGQGITISPIQTPVAPAVVNIGNTAVDPRMQILEQIDAEQKAKQAAQQNALSIGSTATPSFNQAPADNTSSGAQPESLTAEQIQQLQNVPNEDIVPSVFQIEQAKERAELNQRLAASSNPEARRFAAATSGQPSVDDLLAGVNPIEITQQSQELQNIPQPPEQQLTNDQKIARAIQLEESNPDEATLKDSDVLYQLPTEGKVNDPRDKGDMYNRPFVHNDDGTTSTTVTSIFGDDKGQHIISAVWDGKVHTPEEAWERYKNVGDNGFVTYQTVEQAENAEKLIHLRERNRLRYEGNPQALQQYAYELERADHPEWFDDNGNYIANQRSSAKEVQEAKEQSSVGKDPYSMSMADLENESNGQGTNGNSASTDNARTVPPAVRPLTADQDLILRKLPDGSTLFDRQRYYYEMSKIADKYGVRPADIGAMVDAAADSIEDNVKLQNRDYWMNRLAGDDRTKREYLQDVIGMSRDNPDNAGVMYNDYVGYPKQWNLNAQQLLANQRAALSNMMGDHDLQNKLLYAQGMSKLQEQQKIADMNLKFQYAKQMGLSDADARDFALGVYGRGRSGGGGLGGVSGVDKNGNVDIQGYKIPTKVGEDGKRTVDNDKLWLTVSSAVTDYGVTTVAPGPGDEAKPDAKKKQAAVDAIRAAIIAGHGIDTVGNYVINHIPGAKLNPAEVDDLMSTAGSGLGIAWPGYAKVEAEFKNGGGGASGGDNPAQTTAKQKAAASGSPQNPVSKGETDVDSWNYHEPDKNDDSQGAINSRAALFEKELDIRVNQKGQALSYNDIVGLAKRYWGDKIGQKVVDALPWGEPGYSWLGTNPTRKSFIDRVRSSGPSYSQIDMSNMSLDNLPYANQQPSPGTESGISSAIRNGTLLNYIRQNGPKYERDKSMDDWWRKL